jgi:hypothetical protein
MIVVGYTSCSGPKNASPMVLEPTPAIGQQVDCSIHEKIATAAKLNHAVHDGAVMLGRAKRDSPYRIAGWAYRLHPPRAGTASVSNKGSAFNSCAAMSCEQEADFLVLASRDGRVFVFRRGRFIERNGDT